MRREYGTGSFWQLPDGTWRGQVRINGRRRCLRAATKDEIKRKVAALTAAKDFEHYIDAAASGRGVECDSVVYFVEAIGADKIKIGFTAHGRKRLKALCLASPFRHKLLCTLPGNRDVEQSIHRWFRSIRVPGKNEWYFATRSLRRMIRRILKKSKMTPIRLDDGTDRQAAIDATN